MKFTFSHFIILVFGIAIVFSCKTEKPVNTPNNVVYDSISVAKIYHLDNDSTKPSCSLKIKYIYPVEYKDAEVLKKMKSELNFALMEDESYEKLDPTDAVNKYVVNYIENYKRDAKEQFPDWEQSGDTEDYFSYYKTLDTRIVYDTSDILSYQISSMDYKGGANSSTAYRNIVIDLKTGNILHEHDIFVSDYKTALNGLLIKKILQQNKASKTDDLLEFGYMLDDLTSNGNFYVDDKGITYIFNPLEYSVPSIGIIKVPLTYNEINNILKPESPISHLSGV